MKTAHTLFENNDFGPCCFFCQQAAEKALKALLYMKGLRIYGHSLVNLLGRVVTEDYPEPDEAVQQAADRLDKHYISSRYPDALEGQISVDLYTAEMAEEALEWAHSLLQYSGEKLA